MKHVFIDIVYGVRSALSPTHDPASPTVSPVVLNQFKLLSTSEILDTVQHLRPFYCPGDSIPSRLFRKVSSAPVQWDQPAHSPSSSALPKYFLTLAN